VSWLFSTLRAATSMPSHGCRPQAVNPSAWKAWTSRSVSTAQRAEPQALEAAIRQEGLDHQVRCRVSDDQHCRFLLGVFRSVQ
jgi:hypothetical protein